MKKLTDEELEEKVCALAVELHDAGLHFFLFAADIENRRTRTVRSNRENEIAGLMTAAMELGATGAPPALLIQALMEGAKAFEAEQKGTPMYDRYEEIMPLAAKNDDEWEDVIDENEIVH